MLIKRAQSLRAREFLMQIARYSGQNLTKKVKCRQILIKIFNMKFHKYAFSVSQAVLCVQTDGCSGF
jgi:hypothetical protein